MAIDTKPKYKTNTGQGKTPHFADLNNHGYIQGLTYLSTPSALSTFEADHRSPQQQPHQTKRTPLCHYFGGLPYALPPVGPYRWRQARRLSPSYRYGTRAEPGVFTGGAALCPQPRVKEGLWDEDCLQLNVWVPVGEPTGRGWPVLFYIHGGFLQFGTPNDENPIALLSETTCKCIIVTPAYRVNLFGFLASRELAQEAARNGEPSGNFGFWDQRLALEWTYENISCFGGDAENITVGGHSAGAHSAFHQLSYDLFVPSHPIIRRAIMFSQGAGMQPKHLPEIQPQFDSLLSLLAIPATLTSENKLARLRATPPSVLLAAAAKTFHHEFRAVTDGVFVRKELFADIENGAFAHKMRAANVQLIIGEVPDEHSAYATWRPPRTNTLSALRNRLNADYPASAVDVLMQHYCSDGQLPQNIWPSVQNWRSEAFGRVYADLQVHALERGLIDRLVRGGAGGNLFRYRIEWRAKFLEGRIPLSMGVTHGTDVAGVWFWGKGIGGGLTKEEKKVVTKFAEPVWRFIEGGSDVGVETVRRWGASAERRELRRLRGDGVTDVVVDMDWDRGVGVWNLVVEALQGNGWSEKAKL